MIDQSSLQKAARTLEYYNGLKSQLHKIMWGPMYDSIDLLGLALAANPLTHQLPASVMTFFQVPVGQVGGGFLAPKTPAVTNHEGAAGLMPSGLSFVASSVGVAYMPEIPLAIKQHLDRYSWLTHNRMSHRWVMGASAMWSCSEFHVSSPSVYSGIANTFVEFGQNGRSSMRQFPEGGELVFPQGDIIRFEIILDSPVFCTLDGATWNGTPFAGAGSNALDPNYGCLIKLVMDGGRFEEPSA
jgi:hypothetical protein